MAKTQEELDALKEEVEAVSKKLHELTEDELTQVSGGGWDYKDIEIFLEPDDEPEIHGHVSEHHA